MCYERYPRFHTFWGPERWSDQLSISQHPCSWLPPARESHRQPERGMWSEREEERKRREGESQGKKNEEANQLDFAWCNKTSLKVCGCWYVYVCVCVCECVWTHLCGDLQPSHLIESWKVKLSCCSFPHAHTLTHLRGRDEPGLQNARKNSDLSILEIALNLAISWITTIQAQLATILWHCPRSNCPK